jgi:hypothetical protein
MKEVCVVLFSLSLAPSLAGSVEISIERPILFREEPEHVGRWIGDSEIVQDHVLEITTEFVDFGCGKYPYQLLDALAPDERNDYVAFEVLVPPGRGCRAQHEERIVYFIRISRGAARIHVSRCPSYESLAFLMQKSGKTNCSGEFHYKRGLVTDD